MRYCGTFTHDGHERLFNVEATDAENVVNRLMNLYPGSAIAVIESRPVEVYQLPA